MTAVESRHPAPVAVLGDESRAAVEALLDCDPFVNAVAVERLRSAGSLAAERLGGHVVACRGEDGGLAACFAGGTLLPLGGSDHALARLADHVALYPRVSTSVVGRADAVAVMWDRLAPVWGPARAVRTAQPLLVADCVPDVPRDPDVRPVQPRQVDRYLPAAAAMFTDELGMSPHISPGTDAFQARVRHLVDEGRAFASVDFRGQVIFKAEIGAVTTHTAQVQGVWVRPDLRGRGIATSGLATVFAHALQLAPTVSLYVNDFNVAARRVYARLGMQQHATLSTVLLS
jgi:predicted GNAT family acetyltransferase